MLSDVHDFLLCKCKCVCARGERLGKSRAERKGLLGAWPSRVWKLGRIYLALEPRYSKCAPQTSIITTICIMLEMQSLRHHLRPVGAEAA